MEGYDSMDNNSNNNVSGFTNVSDIKFDDTPAESFSNLYGGSSQQNVGNTNVNQVPSMTQNPTMNAGVQAPSMAPNPAMNAGAQTPSMAPNPAMNPGVQAPSMTPNPGTIIQPSVEDLSNMDIDDQKMQSIEEQLSKTSQYNPEEIQKEMISVSTDNQSDKSKSGLAFVIVLFIILALVIAFLPQITKLIK